MVEMVEDLKSMQRAAMTKRRGLMLATLKRSPHYRCRGIVWSQAVRCFTAGNRRKSLFKMQSPNELRGNTGAKTNTIAI
jgi:hypothetical protein